MSADSEEEESASLSVEIENLAQNVQSQCSTTDEDTVSSEGDFWSFFHFVYKSLDFIEPKWCLKEIGRTGQTGFTYHFTKETASGTLNLEMILDYVSKTHVNLRCHRRPRCMARGKVAILGDTLKITKESGKYKMGAGTEEIKDIDNYGEFLDHTHSDRCTG